MKRISGSKSPTSIMMPKYMIANISSAAVGASLPIASMIMSPSPSPAPAKRPKIVGTRMSATIGVSRLVMISTMKVRIIVNPRMTSTSTPSSGWSGGSADANPATAEAGDDRTNVARPWARHPVSLFDA